MATLEIVYASDDIFVILDGVKIAKRGHPGTPHAKTWIPLEPGYTVRDSEDCETIEVEYKGVRIK